MSELGYTESQNAYCEELKGGERMRNERVELKSVRVEMERVVMVMYNGGVKMNVKGWEQEDVHWKRQSQRKNQEEVRWKRQSQRKNQEEAQ